MSQRYINDNGIEVSNVTGLTKGGSKPCFWCGHSFSSNSRSYPYCPKCKKC